MMALRRNSSLPDAEPVEPAGGESVEAAAPSEAEDEMLKQLLSLQGLAPDSSPGAHGEDAAPVDAAGIDDDDILARLSALRAPDASEEAAAGSAEDDGDAPAPEPPAAPEPAPAAPEPEPLSAWAGGVDVRDLASGGKVHRPLAVELSC